MEKIDPGKASMSDIVEKVNELVDFVNQYREERILELEMEINSIQYEKYMRNAEVIPYLKLQLGL